MDNDLDDVSREAAGLSIHAGFPNPGVDRRLQSLDLNQLLVSHPSSTFMFRIRGQDGNAAGIFDGDIAIVDRLEVPRSNDYVLWHNDQSFNLSRLERVAPEGTVWGVITATIHQFRKAGA